MKNRIMKKRNECNEFQKQFSQELANFQQIYFLVIFISMKLYVPFVCTFSMIKEQILHHYLIHIKFVIDKMIEVQ